MNTLRFFPITRRKVLHSAFLLDEKNDAELIKLDQLLRNRNLRDEIVENLIANGQGNNMVLKIRFLTAVNDFEKVDTCDRLEKQGKKQKIIEIFLSKRSKFYIKTSLQVESNATIECQFQMLRKHILMELYDHAIINKFISK